MELFINFSLLIFISDDWYLKKVAIASCYFLSLVKCYFHFLIYIKGTCVFFRNAGKSHGFWDIIIPRGNRKPDLESDVNACVCLFCPFYLTMVLAFSYL